ncbi:C6 zinc finger [Fusarium mexicanum]|uniref:C6 zinc finger n=1 Tax=Fusarium mexicanum TaxID=751941 RepID=A0A8H5JF82_9HYPO|nr:C6 zinc finger [Fusarium mexicanum]
MQSCTESTPITSPRPKVQTRISLTLYEIFDARTSSLPERLFELQLLQHFIDMTKRTTKTQATWSFWMLEQATQSISVMDAILGTAASHLQNSGKFETKLLFISHRYMARAIEVHKRDLDGGVNESNTARLIATCALICMHANLRAYSIESERNQREPHDWFISCRKALNLFNGVSPIENPSISEELSSLSCIISHQIHTNPFSFLLHWKPESGSIYQHEIEICTTAVAQLSYIYANIVTEKPLRFAVAVSDSFVDLVVAKNPRALAVCGYFYMIVRQGRQIWWIDGAPEREFDLVMRCLPKDWRPVMDWAVRVFQWNDGREAP